MSVRLHVIETYVTHIYVSHTYTHDTHTNMCVFCMCLSTRCIYTRLCVSLYRRQCPCKKCHRRFEGGAGMWGVDSGEVCMYKYIDMHGRLS